MFVEEIKRSRLLQTVYWVLQFGFFLSFNDWFDENLVTKSAIASRHYICPPYLQDCGALYFLDGVNDQAIFYAVLGLFLVGSAVAAWQKRWEWALGLMAVPFFWKVLYVGVLTHRARVDFEYFHLPEVFIFLFLSRKEFFLRRAFVVVYMMAATVKFGEAWIVGSYFTSVKTGLPLFPDAWIPFITLGVGLFETLSPMLLLSRDPKIRLPIVALWTLFHVYSISIVAFRYPAHCLPLLLVLFLPNPDAKEATPQFTLKDLGGWSLIALLLTVTLGTRIGHAENWDYTLTGKKFGVSMFSANYQCLSDFTVHFADGTKKNHKIQSRMSIRRCEPYTFWYPLKRSCRDPWIRSIEWRLVSSVNGGPFYQTVSTHNACELEYSAFKTPEWIETPNPGSPIVGYPAKNTILSDSTDNPMPLILGQQQIFLTPIQKWLHANVQPISRAMWGMWFVSLGLCLSYGRLIRR